MEHALGMLCFHRRTSKIWRSDFVDEFYEVLRTCQVLFGRVDWSDVSRTPDRVVIDSIVIGEVARRTAVGVFMAKSGDHIFGTGSLVARRQVSTWGTVLAFRPGRENPSSRELVMICCFDNFARNRGSSGAWRSTKLVSDSDDRH